MKSALYKIVGCPPQYELREEFDSMKEARKRAREKNQEAAWGLGLSLREFEKRSRGGEGWHTADKLNTINTDTKLRKVYFCFRESGWIFYYLKKDGSPTTKVSERITFRDMKSARAFLAKFGGDFPEVWNVLGYKKTALQDEPIIPGPWIPGASSRVDFHKATPPEKFWRCGVDAESDPSDPSSPYGVQVALAYGRTQSEAEAHARLICSAVNSANGWLIK